MGEKVGIIGAGYVGLPLAAAFAEIGDSVVCVDVDRSRVDQLNDGVSYVEDISSERLGPLVERKLISATTEYGDLSEVDAVIIALPTPLTKSGRPDLGHLDEAGESLSAVLRAGQLVVLESTTYPGTTRERLVPQLESSGLEVGRDLSVAYSPERIDPGRGDFTLKNTVKIVGGVTESCTEKAATFYERVVDQVQRVSSPEVAELSKLLENIFRSVNIAFVNELAMLCDRMDLDIWEAIDAASTKPFGFMRFDPGPGLGGHCLPIDPFYLAHRAREFDHYPEFIELAGKVNQAMPYFCFEKISRTLNSAKKSLNGSNIFVLGVAYKPGVGDTRESPALRIIELVRAEGAQVSYHDPHVPELDDQGLASTELNSGLQAADIVVIVTAHPDLDYQRIVERSALVLDLRGVTKDITADNLILL